MSDRALSQLASASEVDTLLVPAAYAARWIALLEERGIDANLVLEPSGLTREMVDAPSGRLPLMAMVQLLWNGVTLANDPSLGLELGLTLKPTSHGALGVALISCDSLGDAIRLGDELQLDELSRHLADGEFTVSNLSQDATFRVRHSLSPRQIATILAGGRIAEHLSGSGSQSQS